MQNNADHLERDDDENPANADTAPTDLQPSEEAVQFESILDSAADTLEALQDLSQALKDVYPTDLDVHIQSSNASASGDTDEYIDIGLTQSLFPVASATLVERLGHAHWRRRQYLKWLKAARKANSKNIKSKKSSHAKKAARQDMGIDAFNFQQPDLKIGSVQAGFLPLTGSNRLSRRFFAPSTAPSEAPPQSVFSKPTLTRVDSVTSLTHSIALSKTDESRIVAAYETERPKVPPPPVPLKDKKPFVCSFCDFEINVNGELKEDEDWEQHVFEDLMTYLCTYDDCMHSTKTYGAKDEWYKHELHTHKIDHVWICEACKEEFATKDLLKEHLLSSHEDDFPTDAEAVRMLAFLRPTHSRKPLTDRRCPLCPFPIEPRDAKDHVAKHMEHLALTSVNGDDSTEEDDTDERMSQKAQSVDDDSGSVTGVKFKILRAFAEESLRHTGLPQPLDDIALEDFNNESDDDMSGESGSQAGDNGVSRNWRVRELLANRQPHAGKSAQHAATHLQGNQHLSNRGPPSNSGTSMSMPIFDTRTFARNEDFMGRDKELAEMYKILREPGRVFVLSAEGGMGKTALAVEFTYAFEKSFHYIFWVQAETRVGAVESFTQIALHLKLCPADSDQETLIRSGREFLEATPERWLLVFDNVDKWDDIDEFTPVKTSATAGGILITTRTISLTAPSRPVNYYRKTLEELHMDEGRKLLIHGLPPELRPIETSIRDPEYRTAGEIAHLAGLPLAIILIAGYMRGMGCKPSEFWSYWEEWRLDHNQPNMKKDGGKDNNNLASIMSIGFADLGPDALKVLRILSFLDSDGVQKELLVMEPGRKGPGYLQPMRFVVWRICSFAFLLISLLGSESSSTSLSIKDLLR
jgi:hypothetical protein